MNAPDTPSPWWVLKSLPRCEKKALQALSSRLPEVFLPCRPSRREYASKSVVFQVPLFPGYLFARCAPEERSNLFRLAPLAGTLSIPDQAGFCRELKSLKRLLGEAEEVNMCPFISTGSRVQITSGRFRGIEGIVQRRRGKFRLVVSIEILRQAVEVECAADLVALAA